MATQLPTLGLVYTEVSGTVLPYVISVDFTTVPTQDANTIVTQMKSTLSQAAVIGNVYLYSDANRTTWHMDAVIGMSSTVGNITAQSWWDSIVNFLEATSPGYQISKIIVGLISGGTSAISSISNLLPSLITLVVMMMVMGMLMPMMSGMTQGFGGQR